MKPYFTTDDGGASRFFYVAKASRKERNAGLEGMSEGLGFEKNTSKIQRRVDPDTGSVSEYEFKPRGQSNIHPCVKPLALMRWLVRLITPPGGVILDPFMGSGTTGCAARLEGFQFIGIEQDETYCEIAAARIKHWDAQSHDEPAQRVLPLEAAS